MNPSEIDSIILSIAGMPAGPQGWERARATFCEIVARLKPGLSAQGIASCADMIIAEARRICQFAPMDPQKLAPYYLGVALGWIMRGEVMAIDDVLKRFPLTVAGLGSMILSEGIDPQTGRPLTKADIEHAKKQGGMKLQ